MRNIPYGYKIVGGKAVINEAEAEGLKKICENYLSGMSFITAAADVGLEMKHGTVKKILFHKRYLGTDFYPAILTEALVESMEAERMKRVKAYGRANKKGRPRVEPRTFTQFSIPKIEVRYEDPVRQTEYAYSLIEGR